MASRMIHYTIARLIIEKIKFKNKNKFLVGSLAPDMVNCEVDRSLKRKAHYSEILEELGLKGYNWC